MKTKLAGLSAVGLTTFLTVMTPICANAQACELPEWAVTSNIQHEAVGDITCGQVIGIYTLFNDLNNTYIGKANLIPPHDFLLRVFNQNDRENFDSYRLEIALHHTSYDSNLKTIRKTQEETKPIILHEYGHAVLSANLSRELINFRALNLVDRTRSFFSHEYLMLQKTDLRESYNAAMLEYSKLKAVFDAVAPYHELFADLFTVNFLGEVQTIENAILFKEKFPSGHVPLGNFSAPTNSETWSLSESHTLFNPVRHFLWKDYLNPASSCKIPKQEKLAVIYEVIRNQIEILLNEKRFQINANDVGHLNSKLIQRFIKGFSTRCPLK